MFAPYEITYVRHYNKYNEKYYAEVTLKIENDKDGDIPEFLLSSKELMGEVLTADWGYYDGRYYQARSVTLSHVDHADLEEMIAVLDADIRAQMNPV